MSGATATKIIKAMIDGEEDIEKLVKYRHGKMRATKEELASSLKGNITEHHKFMLSMMKKSIIEKEKLLVGLDVRIDELLEREKIEVDRELLQTIPGVGEIAAAGIIAEIGTNMEQFPNEQH